MDFVLSKMGGQWTMANGYTSIHMDHGVISPIGSARRNVEPITITQLTSDDDQQVLQHQLA